MSKHFCWPTSFLANFVDTRRPNNNHTGAKPYYAYDLGCLPPPMTLAARVYDWSSSLLATINVSPPLPVCHMKDPAVPPRSFHVCMPPCHARVATPSSLLCQHHFATLATSAPSCRRQTSSVPPRCHLHHRSPRATKSRRDISPLRLCRCTRAASMSPSVAAHAVVVHAPRVTSSPLPPCATRAVVTYAVLVPSLRHSCRPRPTHDRSLAGMAKSKRWLTIFDLHCKEWSHHTTAVVDSLLSSLIF